MELEIFPRSGEKKNDAKRCRREGKIPAIIYGKNVSNEKIYVKKEQIHAALRKIKKGRLSTTVFSLKKEGKKKKVLVKDIQYHPTTYHIEHIDFQYIFDNQKVNVNIPIVCMGEDVCEGIKLGGTLRQVIRKVRVRCLPKNIPQEFCIDLSSLHIGDAKKLEDINIPKTVCPLVSLKEVAIVIAKR